MTGFRRMSLAFCLHYVLWAVAVSRYTSPSTQPKLQLQRNWTLQSSCEVKSTGDKISVPGFSTEGWHHAEVPTTVVAALVVDNTYPDPFFGKNLKSFPGMNYPTTEFFANQDMPEGSPFLCSWWFRTEFTVPAEMRGKMNSLHFDAINYRANVWLNGNKIADAQDVAGTFRVFAVEVSKHLRGNGSNALAVEVFAPQRDDLGITWVDWNPTPGDKDMGLWKDVYLTSSGKVSLGQPFVTSRLDEAHKSAALTIIAELRNLTDQPASTKLNVEIEGIRISRAGASGGRRSEDC